MFRKGKKRHSSSSSQSSEISTKSKSVDSSLGGLSRSSTVASLDTDSAKSFGQASSQSEPCAEFKVKYVGSIERVKPEEGKALQGSLDLINYIDVAQQDGKLPFVPSDEDFTMVVSKYGIKVTTLDQYDVLHRHPLYLIVSMVCYDDGLVAGKSLLALKTKEASEDQCSLWVYQCANLQYTGNKPLGIYIVQQYTSNKPLGIHLYIYIYCISARGIMCPVILRYTQYSPHHYISYPVLIQEHAQSICKVLSTAFDSVLTEKTRVPAE